MMKGFLILSVVVSVAMARPNTLLRSSQLPNVQTYASASASASAIAHPVPQQLQLLRLLPNAPLARDSRVLDSLEVNLTKENQEVEEQRRIQDLEDERDALNIRPRLLSTSSSLPSVPLSANGRILDTLEVRRANAAQAAQNERARWADYSSPISQQQEQNADSLLSATRLAQSLAQANAATGASSRLQILDSQNLGPGRLQQLAPGYRQNLAQLPWIVGPDGQLLSSPLLV